MRKLVLLAAAALSATAVASAAAAQQTVVVQSTVAYGNMCQTVGGTYFVPYQPIGQACSVYTPYYGVLFGTVV